MFSLDFKLVLNSKKGWSPIFWRKGSITFLIMFISYMITIYLTHIVYQISFHLRLNWITMSFFLASMIECVLLLMVFE